MMFLEDVGDKRLRLLHHPADDRRRRMKGTPPSHSMLDRPSKYDGIPHSCNLRPIVKGYVVCGMQTVIAVLRDAPKSLVTETTGMNAKW